MSKLKRGLLSSDVPFWWTILSALVGGAFVLFVIPYFNSNYENSQVRASFLLNKMNQVDEVSDRYLFSVYDYIQACQSQDQSKVDDIIVNNRKIKFEIGIRLSEVVGMFKKQRHIQTVTDMQSSVAELGLPASCPDQSELNGMATTARLFRANSLRVLQAMADSAGL